jgi:hypothetical protein
VLEIARLIYKFMSNKNKIILIFISLSALFLIVAAIFIIRQIDSGYSKVAGVNQNNGNSGNVANVGGDGKVVEENLLNGADLGKGTPLADKDAADSLEKLKANHPELTVEQLNFFSAAAGKKSIAPCEDRKDRSMCVSAVAFITRIYGFCGDVNESAGSDAEKQNLNCYNDILSQKAGADVYKCYNGSLAGDDLKIQCLSSVFPGTYSKPSDCSAISPAEIKTVCEGVVYYRNALMTGKKELCQAIGESFLKSYCLKNI